MRVKVITGAKTELKDHKQDSRVRQESSEIAISKLNKWPLTSWASGRRWSVFKIKAAHKCAKRCGVGKKLKIKTS